MKLAAAALRTHGFAHNTCIPCVGVCRDEICTTLVRLVKEELGEPFSMRGLGGLCFAGNTAFGAMHAHAPTTGPEGSRPKYVYFFAPHIGIGAKGELGTCEREHMHSHSKACGALAGLHGQLSKCEGKTPLDVPKLETR